MQNVDRSASEKSAKEISGGLLTLTALQVLLAAAALVMDGLASCGGCSRMTDSHGMIALAGAVAYSALFLVGAAGLKTGFAVGVFTALGVHGSLVLWMIAAGGSCLPCVASAAVSILLAALTARRFTPRLLAVQTVVGGLLVGAAITWAAESEEAARKADEERFIAELHRKRPFATHQAANTNARPVRVTVFEMAACPYCDEFREFYGPRIEKDFGPHVEISYRPASETTWVRWTPTIVVEGQDPIEGLPRSYAPLSLAIQKSLRERNPR